MSLNIQKKTASCCLLFFRLNVSDAIKLMKDSVTYRRSNNLERIQLSDVATVRVNY